MPKIDTIKFTNVVIPLGTSSTVIYTAPANFTAAIKLLALSNIDTSDRTFDLSYTPSGGSIQQIIDAYSLTTSANIVYIFEDGKPFFMNAGDALSGVGSTASTIIATVSVEEYFDPNR
jgi:hypothetical protein